MLQFMVLQKVGHDLVAEKQQLCIELLLSLCLTKEF